MYNDEFWMRKALDLAVLGQYTASPNPCVGCVIVREERVIGQGFHIRAGTGHAEVNALQNARDNGESAEGATVYVTLEPCSHYGRTPPCAKALVDAGVARVVAAMKDPNPLVSGNGFKILQNAGIKVDCGILEEQAELINKSFLWRMRNGLPFVRIKQAASMDGGIALGNGISKWITCEEARRDVQICRARSCAILTTSRTVIADDPAMTVRRNEISEDILKIYPAEEIRQPDLVVLDSQARVPVSSKIFSEKSRRVFIAVSPTARLSQRYPENCVIIVNDGTDEDLKPLFRLLAAKYNINDLWVEAGAGLAGSLVKQHLYNEYIIYMAPKLLGEYAVHMWCMVAEYPYEQCYDTFYDQCIALRAEMDYSRLQTSVSRLLYKFRHQPHPALAAVNQVLFRFIFLVERFLFIAQIDEQLILVHPVVEACELLYDLVLNLVNCHLFPI